MMIMITMYCVDLMDVVTELYSRLIGNVAACFLASLKQGHVLRFGAAPHRPVLRSTIAGSSTVLSRRVGFRGSPDRGRVV